MRLKTKTRLIIIYIFSVLKETCLELKTYYWSPYPILLILGAIKRIKRRYKTLFVPQGRGRPPLQEEIVELIIEMKLANKSWGALRISQELALLGISVHKKTIQKVLKKHGLLPPPNYKGITWKVFFKSLKGSWAMDFTTVFDTKGLQLFILNVIDQQTRELVLTNCTYNPNRQWIIQQFRNLAIDERSMPAKLIIDNDGIFGKWMVPTFKEFFEIEVKKIPPKSPRFNPFVERFHRSLKEEVLNNILILSDIQTAKLINEYRHYYNSLRPHQGLNGRTPCRKKLGNSDLTGSKVVKRYHLGGLVTSFHRAA